MTELTADERERAWAAARLATAAARLREADDELVGVGRRLRERAPTDELAREALQKARAVANAYASMRRAESSFETLVATGNPLR